MVMLCIEHFPHYTFIVVLIARSMAHTTYRMPDEDDYVPLLVIKWLNGASIDWIKTFSLSEFQKRRIAILTLN